jgi:GNAT superfamily N-acetyltransferase
LTAAGRRVELDQTAARGTNRATGAIRMLANSAVEWANDLGVDPVELTVWEFNTTEQTFFDGFGFELPRSPLGTHDDGA